MSVAHSVQRYCNKCLTAQQSESEGRWSLMHRVLSCLGSKMNSVTERLRIGVNSNDNKTVVDKAGIEHKQKWVGAESEKKNSDRETEKNRDSHECCMMHLAVALREHFSHCSTPLKPLVSVKLTLSLQSTLDLMFFLVFSDQSLCVKHWIEIVIADISLNWTRSMITCWNYQSKLCDMLLAIQASVGFLIWDLQKTTDHMNHGSSRCKQTHKHTPLDYG